MADSLSDQKNSQDDVKAVLMKMASDLNETRSVLFLPPGQYSFDGETEDTEAELNNLPFFLGVDTILEQKNRTEEMIAFNSFISSDGFHTLIRDLAFTLQEETDAAYLLIKQEQPYGEVFLDELGSISLSALNGKTLSLEAFDERAERFLKQMDLDMSNHYKKHEEMVLSLGELLKKQDLQEFLKTRGLSPVFPEKTETRTEGYLKARDGRIVLRFSVNKKSNLFTLAEMDVDTLDTFERLLRRSIETLDVRTAEEMRIDQGKQRILDLRQDAGFITYLEEKGLSLSQEAREDNDYFYYDLQQDDGTVVGSFAVQKMIGEIYLMDEDDVPIASLKRQEASGEDEKKN